LEAISYSYELNQFYNKVEIYCPVGGDHDFVEGICSKCGFNVVWSIKDKEFSDYAKKYINKTTLADETKEKNNKGISGMVNENNKGISGTINENNKGISGMINENNKNDISGMIDETDKQFEYVENTLILKEFADYAKIDIKKIEIDESTITSRDDMRIISLVSLIQTMLTEWRDFRIAADKSVLIPAKIGPNFIEFFRDMIGEQKPTKLKEISNNIMTQALAGRMTLALDKIYNFLIELLASTFIETEQMFVEYELKKFIYANGRMIKLNSWDKWESTTATIVKIMSLETSEEKETNKDPNEHDISIETADENEIDKAFDPGYDLDGDYDQEDNLEQKDD
jgi:hypothetical protein